MTLTLISEIPSVCQLVSQEAMMALIPQHGLLIELDREGRITQSLHDPDGMHTPAISEAVEDDGVLYLGSYYLPYISKVNLAGK